MSVGTVHQKKSTNGKISGIPRLLNGNHLKPQTKNYLEIIEAKYVSGYKIRLTFNDGAIRIMDFEPFLRKAPNPHITQYRQMRKFKSFHLHYGNLMWGDYEMIFPIADLHRGEI